MEKIRLENRASTIHTDKSPFWMITNKNFCQTRKWCLYLTNFVTFPSQKSNVSKKGCRAEPFTIWQKLWTAPPKFPEKSRFFRNISNSIILWKNVSSEPNSFLDLKFSYFKAFWVEAHERFQRLRVFHAQPLSSFSRKSFNDSPLGAGPNSYSTKS